MTDHDDFDVHRTLKDLTPRERQVLKERFGIDISNDASLEEVARQFNITRERIREIEKHALEKLSRSNSDPDDAA